MTLLPTGLRPHRRWIAERLKRAVRPAGARAALAAQIGRYGLDRARGRPLRTGAALTVVGLAAALASSPTARSAVRNAVARLSGTLRRA